MALVALSYDPPAVLKAFAEQRGIAFTLLSDAGSAIIRRYGLLNQQVDPSHRSYGIPHPGTFILDRRGRVTARFFEESYQVRNTVAGISARMGTPIDGGDHGRVRLATDHIDVAAYATDEVVAPGNRFSLVFDVTPRPGIHVYAPGRHSYRPITFSLDAPAFLKSLPVAYPPAEAYHFKPLDERVPVYQKPFRLVQDLVLPVTPETRERTKAPGATLMIAGTLEYQACTDEICFTPVEIPVTWTVRLRPLQ